MIYLVQKPDYKNFKKQLQQMYRLRASVFRERLGWDVQVTDGMEIDQFDDYAPLYILSLNGNGDLMGSVRLLPTTGPNMLADVFNCLLPKGDAICSPLIWESSRFCISDEAANIRTQSKINFVTGELLAAIHEVGISSGLQSIVSVYDTRIKRVLKQAGCDGEILGKPQKIGKVKAYAGLFPMTIETLKQVQSAAGISASVIDTKPVINVAA